MRAAAVEARRRCPQAKVMICVWRDAADESFRDRERKLRCDAVATGVGAAVTAALRLLGDKAKPWTSGIARLAETATPRKGAKAA